VIYINGRPFVLRDVERPFSNLEYTGINRERVEQMEFRLKEDILQEASRYGNKILVTDELPSGQMVDQWESVVYDTVKTPLEVYEELQHQGYLVDYERVPITDEKAPKEGDFETTWAVFRQKAKPKRAIATYRNTFFAADEMKREASLSFFVEYLERYYFLICFAVYVHSFFAFGLLQKVGTLIRFEQCTGFWKMNVRKSGSILCSKGTPETLH
ncbi:uncharacterized protein, partial [Miscanthus floridulus]|uniref:uncharacterized protein n=1 Tax=Miscanthus floridulus TaxID=154761 RepID=UPI00345A373B